MRKLTPLHRVDVAARRREADVQVVDLQQIAHRSAPVSGSLMPSA